MWDEEVGGYKDKTVLDMVFSALNDTRTYNISPSTPMPRSTPDRSLRIYEEDDMPVEILKVPEFESYEWIRK